MKQHGLSANDKDIARWVNAELTLLPGAQAAVGAASAPV